MISRMLMESSDVKQKINVSTEYCMSEKSRVVLVKVKKSQAVKSILMASSKDKPMPILLFVLGVMMDMYLFLCVLINMLKMEILETDSLVK